MLKKLVSVSVTIIFFTCSLFLSIQVTDVQAAGMTYYVATTGNDSNDGRSLSTPFKTIQKAASIMAAGDTCEIRGGTYRETVTPSNSGAASNKITFKNYNNEIVTVSGLDPVTGWTLDSGSIYKAPMSWNMGNGNQIFVDGEMMNMARWPNNTGTLLQPVLATVEEAADSTSITDSAIPGGDGFWNGAQVWCVAGPAYVAQTSKITAYNAAAHTLTFNTFPTYDAKAGNKYYLSGIKGALDTEKEWWYDSTQKQLYLWATGGGDPSARVVEAKKRNYAFDLSNLSYIEINGINIFGASITTNESTSNCVISNMVGKYLSHYNGMGSGAYFSIRGNANTVKNCEFAYTSGEIINIEGNDHQIINNYFHDGNYTATLYPLIYAKGTRMLISHNTGKEAGRAVLGGSSKDSRIQYNDFSFAGRLTQDLGVIYVANSDAQNTVISYNKVHDNVAPVYPGGIYLDSDTSNYIIHHNVIWNCNDCGIRLNIPSNYNLVYNNTVDGGMKSAGGIFSNDMYGDRIVNNIFKTAPSVKPNAVVNNNLVSTDPKYVSPSPGGTDYHLQASSPAIDQGIALRNITDGYAGSAPDQGAYEYGGADWTAGHNFSGPPDPVFTTVDIPYMNRVKNGGLESGDFSNWTKSGPATAAIMNENAWGTDTAHTRTQFYSARLGPETGDEINQTITGLQSGTTYTVSAWVKTDEGETVKVGVRNYDGSVYKSKAATGTAWTQVVLEFTTGAKSTTANVYFNKKSPTGSGFVYCDDIGVVYKEKVMTTQQYNNTNFDDSTWDGWSLSYGNQNVPQIITMPDKTPGKSAFFSQAVNQDALTMSKVLSAVPNPTGKVVFEANIKLVDYQSDRSKYTTRELFNISGGTNNPAATSLIRISSGYIRDRYTNALFMYAQNTWYHIKVVVDFTTANQPVEYYIDEVKIVQNPANGAVIPTTLSVNNLTDFKNLRMITYKNTNDSCETYLDDVQVYQIQDADNGLPDLIGSIPKNDEVNVSEDTTVNLTFNHAVETNTLDTEHLSVTGKDGAIGITDVIPIAANTGCVIKFAEPLAFDTTYTVNIRNIEDIYHQVLNKSFIFTTRTGYLKRVAFDFYRDSISEANKITEAGLLAGNIYGIIDLINYGKMDSTAILVMGLYDGSTLKDVVFSPKQSIVTGAHETLSANLRVALPDGEEVNQYYIKLLVWDSVESMTPVCIPIVLNEKDTAVLDS